MALDAARSENRLQTARRGGTRPHRALAGTLLLPATLARPHEILKRIVADKDLKNDVLPEIARHG